MAEAFLSSYGVEFEKAKSIEKLEIADIVEMAETYTVLVACWEGSDLETQEAPVTNDSGQEEQPSENQPTAEVAGIDLIWFGIHLVVVVGMSQITPPVGFNLFVLQGLTGRDIIYVARAAAPFSFCSLFISSTSLSETVSRFF